MQALKLVIQRSDVLSRLTEARDLPPADIEKLRSLTLAGTVDHVWATEPGRLDAEIATADFLLTENGPITAEMIGKARRLRLIQNGCLRHHGIDLAAARRAGIPVSVAALPGDIAVAEHALLLMMALGRKLIHADQAVRAGEFRQRIAPHITSPSFTPLFSKTLGIVGLGEIGCHVARRARAFDMRILYYSRRRYSPDQEQALGVEYRPLMALMAEADIVDVHLALTPETLGIIGRAEIAAMKPTAILVNTARGAIVDEDALVEALRANRIAGAGLDVFREEPLPLGHPLAALANVVLTPHVAARGVVWDNLRILFANVARVIRGEAPQNVVT